MAIIRKSLKDIKASPPAIDRAKINATTEEDIKRMAVEDGEDQAISSGQFAPLVKTLRVDRDAKGGGELLLGHLLLQPLRNWEQGRVAPDPAARALLTVLAKNPKAVLDALADAPLFLNPSVSLNPHPHPERR